MLSFLLCSRNFLISFPYFLMIHWSWSNVLFSLHVFEYFLLFLLLLNSSFIVLWSDSMQGVISVFLYLLRLALWPKIWPILEKVPWELYIVNVFCASKLVSLPHSLCQKYIYIYVCIYIYIYMYIYIHTHTF
jgi:hypothetical protein